MAATKAMIEYAKAIADKLCLDEPDFSSYEETSSFINEFSGMFKQMRNLEQMKNGLQSMYGKFNREFTTEFQQALQTVYEAKGVYIFWDDNEVVYVGKSINLQERVYSSLRQRTQESEITDVSFIFTEREADMHILEVLLITELKPKLNRDCICADESKYYYSGININELPMVKVFEGE